MSLALAAVGQGRGLAALVVLLGVFHGLAALAAPAAPAASPLPPDLASLKQRGELRVGADPSAGAPYFAKGPAGYVGFEADLARAIATRLGVKARFVETPWRELFGALRAKKIDAAMNGIEVVKEPSIAFSAPYYVASQSILVRSANTRVYALADLKGRPVATTGGTVSAAILGQLKPPAVAHLFPDTLAPFRDLSAGRAEAVLLESAMVRDAMHATPGVYRVVGLPLLPRPYGVALREVDAGLTAAVSGAIATLKRSGEHHRILDAHGLWDSVQGPSLAASPVPSAAPVAHRPRIRRHGARQRHSLHRAVPSSTLRRTH